MGIPAARPTSCIGLQTAGPADELTFAGQQVGGVLFLLIGHIHMSCFGATVLGLGFKARVGSALFVRKCIHYSFSFAIVKYQCLYLDRLECTKQILNIVHDLLASCQK